MAMKKTMKMKPDKKSEDEISDEQDLAKLLKESRQNKNLSLEKLSDLTKIQIYHLEALESGQFEKLPPMIYRDGILKRLAKFLEIDENKILEFCSKEKFSINNYAANNIVVPKKIFYFILTPKKLTLFLGSLFLISVSFYLWYQFNFLVGPPTLVIDPKEDIVTGSDSITINGRTDNRVDLTINGESVYVASNGSFSKNVQLTDGLNAVEIKAVNNFGKVNKIIRNILRKQ